MTAVMALSRCAEAGLLLDWAEVLRLATQGQNRLVMEVVPVVDSCRVREYSICPHGPFAELAAVAVGIDCTAEAVALDALGTGRRSQGVVEWHTGLSSAAVGVADSGRGLGIAVAEAVAGLVVGIAAAGREAVVGKTAVAERIAVVGRVAVGRNPAVLAETDSEEMTSYDYCTGAEDSVSADTCSAGTGYLVSEYSMRMGSPRRATPVDFERKDYNYLVLYFAGYMD